MFSRIFGKRDRSEEVPSKEAPTQQVADTASRALPEVTTSAVRSARLVSNPVAQVGVRAPLRTHVAAAAAGFPADHQIDFVLPTAPQPLGPELTLQQRRDIALETVQQHHQRISNTIRTLWGYRECSVYINKLIMAGGDGMGHARIGFNQDAVEAMLALSDIHDAEFGPPSTLGGALGL